MHPGIKFRAENNDASGKRQLPDRADEIEAVHDRHVVIGDEQVEVVRPPRQPLASFAAIVAGFQGVPFRDEDQAHEFPQGLQILGIEYPQVACRRRGRG